MTRRLPNTLLGGRIRTSTVLLLLAFLAVLTLWVSVRPTTEEQAEVAVVRHTKTTAKTVTRTVRPTPTATPTPTPTALPTAAPAKGAPGQVLPLAQTPTPTPGATDPPGGSISRVLTPGHSPSPTPPPQAVP